MQLQSWFLRVSCHLRLSCESVGASSSTSGRRTPCHLRSLVALAAQLPKHFRRLEIYHVVLSYKTLGGIQPGVRAIVGEIRVALSPTRISISSLSSNPRRAHSNRWQRSTGHGLVSATRDVGLPATVSKVIKSVSESVWVRVLAAWMGPFVSSGWGL